MSYRRLQYSYFRNPRKHWAPTHVMLSSTLFPSSAPTTTHKRRGHAPHGKGYEHDGGNCGTYSRQQNWEFMVGVFSSVSFRRFDCWTNVRLFVSYHLEKIKFVVDSSPQSTTWRICCTYYDKRYDFFNSKQRAHGVEEIHTIHVGMLYADA